jgi:hypothetical protein
MEQQEGKWQATNNEYFKRLRDGKVVCWYTKLLFIIKKSEEMTKYDQVLHQLDCRFLYQ